MFFWVGFFSLFLLFFFVLITWYLGSKQVLLFFVRSNYSCYICGRGAAPLLCSTEHRVIFDFMVDTRQSAVVTFIVF